LDHRQERSVVYSIAGAGLATPRVVFRAPRIAGPRWPAPPAAG